VRRTPKKPDPNVPLTAFPWRGGEAGSYYRIERWSQEILACISQKLRTAVERGKTECGDAGVESARVL
jgi:hypothetical protein